MKYVLCLGTNIGERAENIEKAINAINLLPYTDVLRRSAIYETEPVGYARQQNFYNCALEVESSFEPHEMLGICLGIEAGFGRKRGFANGPRILDIDILLAENKRIETKNLSLPHPRMLERRFVLAPMLDLYPAGEAFGFEFASFLDNIVGQEIRKIDEPQEYIVNF